MTLEEFAKRVEERIARGGSADDRVRRFVKSRWYRIESAYEDASDKASVPDDQKTFESEIITVSYAMSIDYRLASA